MLPTLLMLVGSVLSSAHDSYICTGSVVGTRRTMAGLPTLSMTRRGKRRMKASLIYMRLYPYNGYCPPPQWSQELLLAVLEVAGCQE